MAKDERLRFVPATGTVIDVGDFRPGEPRAYVGSQVVTGKQLSELQSRRERKAAIERAVKSTTQANGGYKK